MITPALHLSMEKLRCLIGQRVDHAGGHYEIVEVLEDGPSLILQPCDRHTVIQPDQHGEAHRRVLPAITIPVLSHDRNELSPAFLALDLPEDIAEY